MGAKRELRKDDINLFAALREQTRQDAERRDNFNTAVKIMLLVCIPSLVMTAWGGLALHREQQTDLRIKEVQSYVENREIREEYNKRNFIRNNMNRLTAYNQACGQYLLDLRKADRIDRERFRQIEAQLPPDTVLTGYQFRAETPSEQEGAAEPQEGSVPKTTGAIQVVGDSSNKDSPAQFAGQLAECGLFKRVDYDGFSSSGDENETRYHFTITCTLW